MVERLKNGKRLKDGHPVWLYGEGKRLSIKNDGFLVQMCKHIQKINKIGLCICNMDK